MREPTKSGPSERPASGLEDFLAWPLAAVTQIAQANLRLLESLMPPARQSASPDSSFPWTSANTIALELATMRLRDFSIGADGPATLICAPYALHGATIADFAPGHSVVETLCQSGLSRVFVTDWRPATPETRYLTIDSYLADLNVAVDELGPPVDLVGLCQGGWLALVYAARFPKKVRRLVLVGAPVDIAAAESQLSRFVAGTPSSMFEEFVRSGEGIVHGGRMLEMWGIAHGPGEAEATLQTPDDIDSARRRELSERFRRWYVETVELPGSFYLQVVQWIFRENRIAEGRFVALGQRIDLAKLEIPMFLLAASHDEVVSVDQLFAVARLVGTPAGHLVKMIEPCVHLGLFLGAKVLDGPWRIIARWLVRDLSEPQTSL
ncbi:acyl-CoA synthetase [mine drainage metagenome]|uniref:Acyl-CoA synthetase n=1 Tax=mine drainage metagenome TaxID=410659 RepID=A0A1J5PQN2_9ZZZZ